jgi:hypothetical protein
MSKRIKDQLWVPLFVLAGLTGVFFFFYYFGHHDAQTLAGFVASYEKFDRAAADLSVSKTGESEKRARDALREFQSKATFRLSSLTRNDGELMRQAREIATLSERELDSLRLFIKAMERRDADSDRLAKEYASLRSRRKAAYAHFRQLAGWEPKNTPNLERSSEDPGKAKSGEEVP